MDSNDRRIGWLASLGWIKPRAPARFALQSPSSQLTLATRCRTDGSTLARSDPSRSGSESRPAIRRETRGCRRTPAGRAGPRAGGQRRSAMAEKGGVKTDQLGMRKSIPKEPRKGRPNIAHVSGNQYPHARSNLCCGRSAAPSARRSDLITIPVKKKGRHARDFFHRRRKTGSSFHLGAGTRIATCTLLPPGRREQSALRPRRPRRYGRSENTTRSDKNSDEAAAGAVRGRRTLLTGLLRSNYV